MTVNMTLNMTVSNLGVTDQIKVTGYPEVSNDLRLLEQAFGERLAALGGRAVVLESLVKVIRESGYQGTEQQAASALAAICLRVSQVHCLSRVIPLFNLCRIHRSL